ncbi:hypothetical protein GCM10011391_15760 [Pullulanibacillus camelliae]|uniref:DUF58 domain-containing protein n=1 Tax=Pullulanibacillus camelliae TaxID=1707096 RepID=A0A8J2YGT5_9BACL|nr:DUF58 domain-containing protein [Pullulanibacillus camelliae]GGE37783.1 hypothetical protein GCM10011391_15760 [Pullulanibacillus camelliae]
MVWRATPIQSAIIETFTIIGAAVLLASLIFTQTLLFFAGAFFLVLGVYPRLYLKHMVRHLGFFSEKEKIRLSVGETGQLQLVFGNKSWIPVVNGKIEFLLSQDVEVTNIEGESPYQTPLFIPAKQVVRYPIECLAKARGVVRMRNLKLIIHDPLRLASITLSSDFVKKEIIIYPQAKVIGGTQHLQLPIEGRYPRQSALFEDRAAPVGTRDYVPSDSIRNVHWKASARTGQLQTKLFDKTLGMTWTIVTVLDLYVQKGDRENLEEELARVARLCYLAEKQGVDFEILVNTRTIGQGQLMRLPLGQGRMQLLKAMDFLAHIHTNQMKIKPAVLFGEIDRERSQKRIIILIDHTDDPSKMHFVSKWLKQGMTVLKLTPQGDLTPMGRGGRWDAQQANEGY